MSSTMQSKPIACGNANRKHDRPPFKDYFEPWPAKLAGVCKGSLCFCFDNYPVCAHQSAHKYSVITGGITIWLKRVMIAPAPILLH